MASNPVDLSKRFLRAVRADEPAEQSLDGLASLDRERLRDALSDDPHRTAFWLNVYNASVQYLLAADPTLYDSKRRFFGVDRITVAGEELSLDDVEHGLLRRSQWKYGLGYVPNPFPGSFERAFRIEERDPRIHFALNCGARSCPPIAVYSPEPILEELDLATEQYLDAVVEYDPEAGVVRVPRHCLWYRGDFGGKRGVFALLRRHDLLPRDAAPRLTYDDYDWKLDLDRYRDTTA